MCDFIICVVMNIYGHVLIEDVDRVSVFGNATPPWDLAVLDAAEFVVLDPKIGLEYLERRCEPERAASPALIPFSFSFSFSSSSPNAFEAEVNSAAPGASAIAPTPMRQRNVRRGSARRAGERLATSGDV